MIISYSGGYDYWKGACEEHIGASFAVSFLSLTSSEIPRLKGQKVSVEEFESTYRIVSKMKPTYDYVDNGMIPSAFDCLHIYQLQTATYQ